MAEVIKNISQRILIQLKGDDGSEYGGPMDVSIDITNEELKSLYMLHNKQYPDASCLFFIKDKNIAYSLKETIKSLSLNLESLIEIICAPQSPFYVRTVTRCTSSIPGHTAAITVIAFSPEARNLATGSGDTTVRLWDIYTETPLYTLEGHKDWILALAWSPTGHILASGDKQGIIILWNPLTGKQLFPPLKQHKKWITSICWEPLHLYENRFRFASSSKDGSIIIWNADTGTSLINLSGHTQCVSCVKWSGHGLIYSSSHDTYVGVYKPDQSMPIKILKEHGHWVNHLALNTDYIIRSSCYDPLNLSKILAKDNSLTDLVSLAKERYSKFTSSIQETLVSCSDDFTLILWNFTSAKHTTIRLTGHQGPINHVLFSPNGRMLASASFDKSIKLWHGQTGKFIVSLRGHVNKVYQLAWSSDSRMICSASADSTIKVWDSCSKTLLYDLPGHSDEVYALDWSNDGEKVASGGKDKLLKLWRS